MQLTDEQLRAYYRLGDRAKELLDQGKHVDMVYPHVEGKHSRETVHVTMDYLRFNKCSCRVCNHLRAQVGLPPYNDPVPNMKRIDEMTFHDLKRGVENWWDKRAR